LNDLGAAALESLNGKPDPSLGFQITEIGETRKRFTGRGPKGRHPIATTVRSW
jgi:hypothetical protein